MSALSSSAKVRHFNPRTPCGVRPTTDYSKEEPDGLFQSTHPVRGATTFAPIECILKSSFQSTHPVRGATNTAQCHIYGWEFQSTHPVRGATLRMNTYRGNLYNFNPRTPCGVRRKQPLISGLPDCISIHAPRAGCDCNCDNQVGRTWISIHAPRAGCDLYTFPRHLSFLISIHAPRAGCDNGLRRVISSSVISIHAPRAGCDTPSISISKSPRISIHAPRAGCDYYCQAEETCFVLFQSTHPVRGATCFACSAEIFLSLISIHAPRAGCDAEFLSSLVRSIVISIHAPRAGCDHMDNHK